MIVAPRPRVLYSSIFVWISVTGGRFKAPFLEHEAGFSDSLIGITLALQGVISCLLGPWFGSLADSRERLYPHRGRVQALSLGIFVASILFLLSGARHVVSDEWSVFRSPGWFLGLQILYATCSTLVFPILDGMTIEYLERHSKRSDYGRERLWGAIFWAVANMILGPLIDKYGYFIFYPCTMISTAAVAITVVLYVRGQDASNRELSKRKSDVQQNDADIMNVNDDEDDDTLLVENDMVTNLSSWALTKVVIATAYGVAFFFSLVLLSSGQAVVESLIFLFFEFLGGSNTLCSWTVLLTVLFEIPLFHLAPVLLERFGEGFLLLVANASFVSRVVGYTLIPQGKVLYVLLFEPLHGITYALSTTASVEFVARHMPAGYQASGQGIVGFFKGLGSVMGLFLGGILMDEVGPRTMYRLFALTAAIGMMVFGCVVHYVGGDATMRRLLPQEDKEEIELGSTEKSEVSRETDSMEKSDSITESMIG
jgi:Na+/melibiose symporter-like transporter